MRTKRIIASLLFFISILMLVVPVMPHHHHTDGLICMKNDISHDCCESAENHMHEKSESTPLTHHHCCCNTDCASAHFIQQPPASLQCNLRPDYLWVNVLYFEPVFRLLLLPEEKGQKQAIFYIETLHSILATTIRSLRAPPTILA